MSSHQVVTQDDGTIELVFNSANPGINVTQLGTGTTINASGTTIDKNGNITLASGAVYNGLLFPPSHGAGTLSSNAATINAGYGEITTGALSTASGGTTATITITNSSVLTTSKILFGSTYSGTATAGDMHVTTTPTVSSGQFTFTLTNLGSAAANGSYIIPFLVV